MADRRPDDSSPTAPFTPVPGQGHPPMPDSAEEQRALTERINAAYASSSPIVPDDAERAPAEDPRGAKPTGAERFAAVLAATTAKAAEGRSDHPDDAGQESPGSGTGSTPASAPKGGAGKPAATKRVRRARLRLTHVDPWSVMKTSFLLAVAVGVVTVVAVAVVWSVLGAAGVWTSINSTVGDVVGETGDGFRIEDYLGMSRVMGFTMIVAVVDVVLITVIATLGAFLYNLAAALLGGVEVVLAEEDR
jgi:hypothetical protein